MVGGINVSRRKLLQTGAGVTGVGAMAYAGANLRGDRVSESAPAVEDRAARRLAERYAPVLKFDAREQWFPTDPLPYAVERGGETVVDGFEALDRYAAAGRIPEPTVHYAVRRLTDDLLAVQYWSYSVFDQFAVNFHWHDWELLQVFVDTGADPDRPVLLAASAHARNVPNNEFLDPDLDPGAGRRPTVLAELGSHSSATDVNGARGFQRFPGDIADLTNRALSVADLAGLPAGYGLPRDEGFRLPVVVPELAGAPVFEHPRLPNVGRADLLPPEVTVRSFSGLAAPPEDLPPREPGPTLAPESADGVDAVYDLVPMRRVREAVDGFAGPQLSFEFAVPQFAEDAVAGHLTSVDTPWSQPRYADPLADVTDPRHRQALADRYGLDADTGVAGVVVGTVRTVVSGGDGTLRPAYRENSTAREHATVSTTVPTVESVALVESPAPVAAPTTNGALLLRGIPAAEHRLTVNGPGRAPYAERFRLGEGPRSGEGSDGVHVAGGGRIATVRNENAVKVRGETPAGVARLRVEEDFAGSVYDARPPGSGGAFGVYVHRGGAYAVEVTDRTGAVGVDRVTPGPNADTVTIPAETGPASVFSYLASYLGDTASLAADVGGLGSGGSDRGSGDERAGRNDGGGGDAARGVAASLRAAADAAGRARAAAAAGDSERAVGRACDLQVRLGDARGGLGDLPREEADLLRLPVDRAAARTRQARAALE